MPTHPRRDPSKASTEPAVEQLITLLKSRSDLEQALRAAIDKAAVKDIENLEDFYRHLDEELTVVPTERELAPRIVKIHFIIGQAENDQLNEDADFSAWLSELAKAWGAFMDTPASVGGDRDVHLQAQLQHRRLRRGAERLADVQPVLRARD